MNLAVGGFAAKAILVLLVLAAVAVTTRARYKAVLRLGPGIRTTARYRWAFLPSRAARLHRRLQVVAGVCIDALGGTHKEPRRRLRRQRASTPEADALSGAQRQVRNVIDEAIALDKQLVAASKATGAERRQRLKALAGEIDRLEGTARRLLSALRHATASAGPVAPDSVLDQRPEAQLVEPPEPAGDARRGDG